MSRIIIEFFLNNNKIIEEVDSNISLLEYLREYKNLKGTKCGCNEGDCGACTVAIGEKENNIIKYKAVNSCIYPISKVHNKHIITIEGLEENGKLHEIQRSMIKYNAVQCGFCTPGMIMSLFCLYINNDKPNKEIIKKSLEGNLCRCTGYISIKKAAENINGKKVKMLYLDNIKINNEKDIIKVRKDSNYYTPKSLNEFYRSNLDGKIINGGTDIYVGINIQKKKYKNLIDISNIKELKYMKTRKNYIEIGGNITFTKIIENEKISKTFPEFRNMLLRIGSMQIRNVATLVGNIANASPIADATVFLLALNAQLRLISQYNERIVDLSKFYKSYKKTLLNKHELIKSIIIPINYDYKLFEKTAKRKVLDIASVNSAITMNIRNKRIKYINIALGGVKEIPFIANKTNKFLMNKTINKETVEKAIEIILKEISPISDVRASKEQRALLVKNHIIKHFYKLFEYG